MMMKIFTPKTILCLGLILLGFSLMAQPTDMLMQHNDYGRTGWNKTETILSPSTITPTSFGLLNKINVDDQIFAQPLIATGITIGGVSKNLLLIATVNNTVYAIDADNTTLAPYWTRNFTPSGMIPPNATYIHTDMCHWGYTDFKTGLTGQQANFGIVGTPVIDKTSGTLYFMTRHLDPAVADNHTETGSSVPSEWTSTGFYEVIHAIDLATGLDKFNSPYTINSTNLTINGTGAGSSGGTITFDPRRQNQRGGLLLLNGVVYIPFSAHCDMDYYHGWVLGFDAGNLTNIKVKYVTTPNDDRGGIWMSGTGISTDGTNLFFASGNANNSSAENDPGNTGTAVVKATPDFTNRTLTNISWFHRSTYSNDDFSDQDFGTGVMLVPGTNTMVTAHKSGLLYLLKQNGATGSYNETSPNLLDFRDLGSQAQSHSSISYFGGTGTPYIYTFSEFAPLTAYPVNGTNLGTAVTSNIPQNIGHCGGAISVTSNGTNPASGVLWVSHPTGTGDGNAATVPGTLRAVNATNLTQELWNSDNNPLDQLGFLAKWNCVTVSNGIVYAPTFSNTLNVYGILAGNSRCVNNAALTGTASSNIPDDPANPPANAIDGNPLAPTNNTVTIWKSSGTATPANPTWLKVDLGARYDICRVEILWNKLDASINYYDYAVDFTVDISDDGSNWTTINTTTGNSFTAAPLLNSYNENSTGRYLRINVTQQGTAAPVVQEFRIFGQVTNSCAPPNVAGLTVTNITQGSATLNWTRVAGINNYIVKYKPGSVSSYITRYVNDATSNPLTLNITALSCSANYSFQVQADCGGGSVSNAAVAPAFNTLNCTNPCTNLTRFSNGDLGDIQTAGSTCYNNSVWTIQGEGTGIGGTADVFQINDASLSIDEEYIVRVASQDNINGQNQALIMMREDLTDVGRYMAVGKLGNGDVVTIYRNAVGAAAFTTTVTNPGMSFFRIVKTGSQYTSYYGATVTGPWVQVGATQDLGFGASGSVFIAMGVSSKQPHNLSTATFDNLTENSTILPVELKDFTATNISNKYVALVWHTTSEENTDRFEIERSANGAAFEKIMTVKAAGNSSTEIAYSANDLDPANGIDFYRLKQIDLDGKFAYSDTEKVKFGSDVAPVIYPNPTSGIFKAVPGTEPIMEIKIYDVQGRAVLFFAGNTILEDMRLNVSALPNAVYILKIKTQSKTYQFKLMKQ